MLTIDFETRSRVDLPKRGAYIYAQDVTTDILCMSYAFGDEPVQLWKPADGRLPERIAEHIKTGGVLHAWNSAFERLIWNNVGRLRYGFPLLPIESFVCIAALARARGYPGKLDNAARFHNGAFQKDMDGYRVMMRLCKPRDDGTWNEDPEDLQKLYDYCLQDTEVERYFLNTFIYFSEEELASFHRSEHINDRGILCDRGLAEQVVQEVELNGVDAMLDLAKLTDGVVTAPTQVARMLAWVQGQGYSLPDLNKSTVHDFLDDGYGDDAVRQVLEIRLDSAKASVSKFAAMVDRSTADRTVRGLFLWRGAGQTGRYASMGIQIHNLIRESAPKLIPLFKKRGIAGLKMLGAPMVSLSKMVRPAFMAAPGHTFLICDFAQIEARIVAWLSGEDWLLEAFAAGRDVYCEFGSIAFERLITKADVSERGAAKASVLGLGFGGGTGALERSLKAINIKLPAETLEHLVDTYRDTNTKIKKYWYQLDKSALAAMCNPNVVVPAGKVSYLFDETHLWCRLPSGRLMCYPFAEIVEVEKFDTLKDVIRYSRGNRRPKSGEVDWPTVDLWHGMLMENLAQAIALDLLDYLIERLHNRMTIRAHIHDEVVIEVKAADAQALEAEVLKLMRETPAWAEGLPADAEIKVSERYVK